MRVHRLYVAGLGLLLTAGCSSTNMTGQASATPAPAPTPVASVAAPAAPAKTPAADSLEVLFPVDSASLSAPADGTIDHAARLFREGHPVVMTVTGYSDAQGQELPNLILSAQRAAAVKAALVARGIPADRLEAVAFGVAEPAVPNDPTAAQNRRVVITWR